MPLSPDAPRTTGTERWPPLLLALRRAARPDRARVEAYLGLTQRPAGWAAYAEFLAVHRAWLASLDRTLADAGLGAPGPLPDAVDPLEPGPPGEPVAPEGVLLPAPRTRAQALGYLYVFEAFRLGCSVLARRVRGSAVPAAEAGPWRELVTALRAAPDEDHGAVIQAAREAFTAWEQRLAGPLATLGLRPVSAEANAA